MTDVQIGLQMRNLALAGTSSFLLMTPIDRWAKTPFDRGAFELGVRHLDESLAALRKMSEGAYPTLG